MAKPSPLPETLYNLEAERCVIASIIIGNELPKSIQRQLTAEAFHDPACRAAYQGALDCLAYGRALDQVTIAHEMAVAFGWRNKAALRAHAFLCDCIMLLPTHLHLNYYAKIVADMASRRQALDHLGKEAQRITEQPTRRGGFNYEPANSHSTGNDHETEVGGRAN